MTHDIDAETPSQLCSKETVLPPEEFLEGGNMANAVKFGDTVLRSAGPRTPTIHRVLEHCRANGIDWVPKPLGFDSSGREVLTFLHGESPNYPMPEWVWDVEIVGSAARRLAEFHDATATFEFLPKEDVWQLPSHLPFEVVCHNDFAQYNFVFSPTHELTGVIDFDTCSPGPRLGPRVSGISNSYACLT